MSRSKIFTISRYVLDRISPQEIRRDYAVDVLLIPDKDLRVAYFEKDLEKRVKSERDRLQKDRWVIEKVLALHHFQFWMNYLGLSGEYQTVEVFNPRRDRRDRPDFKGVANPLTWKNEHGAVLTVDITTAVSDEEHHTCAVNLEKMSGESDWRVYSLNIRKFEPLPADFDSGPGCRHFIVYYKTKSVDMSGDRLNLPFPWKSGSEHTKQFHDDMRKIYEKKRIKVRPFEIRKTIPTPQELL